MTITLGDKLRKLRKENGITQKRIAELLHISTSKYRDWETNVFPPNRAMLPVLAALLNTTPEYLTEEESPVEIRSVSSDEVKKVPCKLCGKDTPEGNEYCHECVWKAKWPEHILNSPELAARRKRSHSTKLLSVDWSVPQAFFRASNGRKTYVTTLQNCTCRDFAIMRGGMPCKHILRLAEELGLFHSEYFAPGENDYTMHTSPDVPQYSSEKDTGTQSLNACVVGERHTEIDETEALQKKLQEMEERASGSRGAQNQGYEGRVPVLLDVKTVQKQLKNFGGGTTANKREAEAIRDALLPDEKFLLFTAGTTPQGFRKVLLTTEHLFFVTSGIFSGAIVEAMLIKDIRSIKVHRGFFFAKAEVMLIDKSILIKGLFKSTAERLASLFETLGLVEHEHEANNESSARP